ncbi:MAG: hypothetical protein ACLUKN_00300 [Bacilli bacterium]
MSALKFYFFMPKKAFILADQLAFSASVCLGVSEVSSHHCGTSVPRPPEVLTIYTIFFTTSRISSVTFDAEMMSI